MFLLRCICLSSFWFCYVSLPVAVFGLLVMWCVSSSCLSCIVPLLLFAPSFLLTGSSVCLVSYSLSFLTFVIWTLCRCCRYVLFSGGCVTGMWVSLDFRISVPSFSTSVLFDLDFNFVTFGTSRILSTRRQYYKV